LLGRYTDKVNYQPYETYFRAVNDPNIGLDNTESKFQLSFKLKAAEDLFGRGIDLWFGYTQQNYWQVYNKNISAPFRETNYEPEAFVTIPTDYSLLGLKGRFVNLGFILPIEWPELRPVPELESNLRAGRIRIRQQLQPAVQAVVSHSGESHE
jgi:phospholipase A1